MICLGKPEEIDNAEFVVHKWCKEVFDQFRKMKIPISSGLQKAKDAGTVLVAAHGIQHPQAVDDMQAYDSRQDKKQKQQPLVAPPTAANTGRSGNHKK